MTLLDTQKGKRYCVKNITAQENILRRLQALGILEGTRIEILNKKGNGTTIIRVRGTRWAMGCDIAGGIEVAEVYE